MSLITRDLLGNNHFSKPPDLKPENDYLQRRRSKNTNRTDDQTVSNLQDLNKPPLNLLDDDTNLDLKLVSLSTSSPPYTLGKVKYALERAEKEDTKKRSISMSKSHVDDESYAAGCPSCMLYVLVSSRNHKCPCCNTTVLSPTNMKKPRIDLNINI